MVCPKCKESQLEPLSLGAVEVDRCPGCEGLWFDPGELEELLGRPARTTRALQRGQDTERLDVLPARCPRDSQPLRRRPSAYASTVTIDTCPTCEGLWLDAGEFRLLKQAFPDQLGG